MVVISSSWAKNASSKEQMPPETRPTATVRLQSAYKPAPRTSSSALSASTSAPTSTRASSGGAG